MAPDATVIDPGFGFSKTVEQNLLLFDQLEALQALGRPVLVGPSRKRFLGAVTGQPVEARDRATAAACALAWERGARLFRVHDVAAAREALTVVEALGGAVVPFGQLPFPTPGWRDVLEILIVAYVVYALLRFLVGTRALQIVFGLLILAVIYLAAFLLKLSMITYLLGVVFTYGVFAALVVFQPELRQALARLGETPVFRLFGVGPGPAVADEIAQGRRAAEPERDRRHHRDRARGAPRRVPGVRHGHAGQRVGRPARDDLQPVLAAARRRGARPGRRDRRRRLHPAADAEPLERPLPRHAAPRGARALRGDRRAGPRGVRGDARSSRSPGPARCSAGSTPTQVRAALGRPACRMTAAAPSAPPDEPAPRAAVPCSP